MTKVLPYPHKCLQEIENKHVGWVLEWKLD